MPGAWKTAHAQEFPAGSIMSDVTLPENLDEWPRDPFVLFGVTHTVSQRDLRRVYARLIREYKPERSPEQFRRIREAYETLQQYAAWNETRADGHEAEPVQVKGSESQSKPAPGENLPDLHATPTPVDTQEQCWRWAVAGELERAYKTLLDMRDRQPQQAALYLRLYWLLIAKPELDPNRLPCNWLVKGLVSCPQYAKLLDAYAEELTDNPGEALSQRFVELLEKTHGPLLVELLERRWQALAKLERWDVANDDLELFGDRVCRDDEAGWVRLLLSLASKSFRIQLHDINSIFRVCQARIKNLGHLGLAHGDLFDRAEMLNQLARESVQMLPYNGYDVAGKFGALNHRASQSIAVLEVVSHFIAGRMDEATEAAEPFLVLVCATPREGLRLLDQTASIAPNIFIEFGRLLEWLFWSGSRKETLTHSSEAAGRLAHRLLDEVLGDETYPNLRVRILHFCCDEALSPEQICEILEAPVYSPNYLGPKIASDLPLRWTYRAFRLGWAI
jgi:hypothetical protein